jgi:hypothetical protein
MVGAERTVCLDGLLKLTEVVWLPFEAFERERPPVAFELEVPPVAVAFEFEVPPVEFETAFEFEVARPPRPP